MLAKNDPLLVSPDNSEVAFCDAAWQKTEQTEEVDCLFILTFHMCNASVKTYLQTEVGV